VITPAYNVDPYIGEAVDSVLAQSFSDYEYLVVDDGSTDSTADRVLERAQADSRIRLIRSENRGAANARNIGIEQARGKFIAFLDGDDRWHRDFLKDQLDLLTSADNSVAAVFARSRVISEEGRVYLFRWQRAGRYDFDDMLIGSCPPRTGSSLLIKKTAFDTAGLFEVSLDSAQDLDMWLRIQYYSGMPYFVCNAKYRIDIRVRPGAISRDWEKRFEALDLLIERNVDKIQRKPRGLAYVRAAVFAYRAGEDEIAQRWARQAKEAPLLSLVADPYGRRLLGWTALNPHQRAILRGANHSVRVMAGLVAGVAGGVLQ
jgi:glycosyltransferase involved in cell wall biosynthesis